MATAVEEARQLAAGEHPDPHSLLGVHDLVGERGVVVRAWHPDAVGVDLVTNRGARHPMTALVPGVFEVVLAGRARAPRYTLEYSFDDGVTSRVEDPYRFACTIEDSDLEEFVAGTHRRLWRILGSHVVRHGGQSGVRFAVWAPHALAVRVVGDFCSWDGRILPMRRLGESGVWELFVPGLTEGATYKYEILTTERQLRLKTDPFARSMEPPPHSASRVVAEPRYRWSDQEWMRRRRRKNWRRAPMSIYEVHLGSWWRDPDDPTRLPGYRELAPRLIEHVKDLGFTHIELMPVAEHAFYGSWGYQVTGYYAPTFRYGPPDDLRFFVEECHKHGIGVLLDWVPAHFPKDDFALRRFDGPPLYEGSDPQMGEHPDWGTKMFDYGRPEVRNFLVANALFWLREFHFDGLRVDAVSWMLYLDYGRKDGEWTPNREGGSEHLDGIALLHDLQDAVREGASGAITIAEEATAWPGVTAEREDDGLGFTFKWNMGWMNDTLRYFSTPVEERKDVQDLLTFAMQYEPRERYVNPLSHDEVVHLKRSLLGKMPGDEWRQFANLRALMGYQFLRPGKKLLFMGTELAPEAEWDHDVGLPWEIADDPYRARFGVFLRDLARLYRDRKCLWRRDPDPENCAWIDGSDSENSILSFVRRDGTDHLVCVWNFTPTPRDAYRIGVPARGEYAIVFNSDDERYGGSGYKQAETATTDDEEFFGWRRSVTLDLPPLGVLVLAPSRVSEVQSPPEGSVPRGE